MIREMEKMGGRGGHSRERGGLGWALALVEVCVEGRRRGGRDMEREGMRVYVGRRKGSIISLRADGRR